MAKLSGEPLFDHHMQPPFSLPSFLKPKDICGPPEMYKDVQFGPSAPTVPQFATHQTQLDVHSTHIPRLSDIHSRYGIQPVPI